MQNYYHENGNIHRIILKNVKRKYNQYTVYVLGIQSCTCFFMQREILWNVSNEIQFRKIS